MKMTQRYTAWPACSDHAARSPRTRDMRQQGLTGGDIVFILQSDLHCLMIEKI